MTSLADRAHVDFAPPPAPVPAFTTASRPASRSGITFAVDVLLSTVTGLGAIVAASPRGSVEVAFLAALPILWVAALGFARGYRSGDELWSGSSLCPVWRAFAFTAALSILPALLVRDDVQRTTAAELVALGILTAAARSIRRLRGTDHVGPRMLLVGSAAAARRIREKLDSTAPQRGRRLEILHSAVAPMAGPIPAQRVAAQASEPRSGEACPLDTLLQEVDDTGAQAVMLASGSTLSDTDARRLAWELAERGVELLLSTEAFGAHSSRTVPVSVNGTHAVRIAPPQLGGPAKFVKAAFERTAALVGLVVLLPLLATIAVLIRLTSRGPALFRQERTGRDGKVFVVYKFRTMRLGSAEEFLALAAEAGQSSLFFKLERDPRITRLGAFLRKTSLDELPQLLNVVLGNMALVGPRPLPVEVDQSDDVVQRRLRALPGITGQWQVSGRSSLKGDRAVEHDVDYVDNWRLGLDADILRRTVSAVLRSDGAY